MYAPTHRTRQCTEPARRIQRHSTLHQSCFPPLKADCEWSRGKGLTQNSLAVILGGGGGRGRAGRGGFGIRSVDVHLPGDIHGKGYKREQFKEVWARYLPPDDDETSSGGGE
jgi:hypothetical protein